jgi:hypothetical protein
MIPHRGRSVTASRRIGPHDYYVISCTRYSQPHSVASQGPTIDERNHGYRRCASSGQIPSDFYITNKLKFGGRSGGPDTDVSRTERVSTWVSPDIMKAFCYGAFR